MDAPVVIGYDGSPPSGHALRRSAGLLAPREALVVVVWEGNVAYDLLELPLDIEPAPLHIESALQTAQAIYEGAQRLAQKGAELAGEVGFDAEPLAVADE